MGTFTWRTWSGTFKSMVGGDDDDDDDDDDDAPGHLHFYLSLPPSIVFCIIMLVCILPKLRPN